MTFGRVLVVCAAISVAVIAAAPNDINKSKQNGDKKTCCYPDKIESVIGMTEALYNTHTKEASVLYLQMNHSLDATQEKIAVEYQAYPAYRSVYDFKQHVQYTIIDEAVCFKKHIDMEFSTCLPEHSVYTGHFYMGAEDEMLEMDGWYYQFEEGNQDYKGSISFTESCLPVGGVTVVEMDHFEAVITSGYTGIQLEITNPAVFDIPKICEKTEEMFNFNLDAPLQMAMNALPIIYKK